MSTIAVLTAVNFGFAWRSAPRRIEASIVVANQSPSGCIRGMRRDGSRGHRGEAVLEPVPAGCALFTVVYRMIEGSDTGVDRSGGAYLLDGNGNGNSAPSGYELYLERRLATRTRPPNCRPSAGRHERHRHHRR